jgi:alginate O-acetyltransferase complex protein AlgJ
MVPERTLMSRIALAAILLTSLASAGCATSGTRFPWPAHGPALAATRADVTTENASYRRTTSQVLVRKISRATRASLDFAAYHANFMNADPAPEGALAGDKGKTPNTANPFGGVLVLDSITGSIAGTKLSAEERTHPLALPPLVELLTSKHVAGADRFEDVVARVRSESWGLTGGPQIVRQSATEAFLHDPGQERPVEIWLKVEFAPWFTAFASPPDEDGDGFAEIYGLVAADALGPSKDIVEFIRSDYEGRVFTPAEVKAWAHQLASYWYPSYNTDLVAAPTWPAADTEPAIRKELGAAVFTAPTVVMRGKPLGKPVYNVFLVEGAGQSGKEDGKESAKDAPSLKLRPSVPSPNPAAVLKAVRAELSAHGGSWTAWLSEVADLHASLKKRLDAIPAGAKAIKGSDGFLFFRQSLAYVQGGDLGAQHGDRNPLPVIVEFKNLLAKHGVDFLFVPVPTKVEIFPDKTGATTKDASLAHFAGKVANPFERKFLLELGEKGVETLDLLPAFLAERKRDAKAKEPLYQTQDTHWTTRGLELAAKLVAGRVEHYPWFKGLTAHRQAYKTKNESFTRHGDLVSRLPEMERKGISPETLIGHQVAAPDGTLYDDDPDSPIVVLGDSFTGVYQLMDCEHAGVSAHIAKEIGHPVDLVMSYGGGPNVREKLLKRGEDKLATKKLVIWMMTARDLFDHAEGWQPLDKK